MKIFPIVYLSLFMTFISTGPIQGEEEPITLSWRACIEQARKNNPDLMAAEAAVEQSKSSIGRTRSGLLPQVSGSLSARHSKSDGEDRSESYSYSLSARQLIFDGLKSWYDLAASEQQFIVALFSYDTTSSSIRLSLRTAFIELLKAQESIELTRSIAERRKQQLDMVSLRYDAGREHKGSLMTAQANLAEARFDVRQAQREIRLARQQLATEMGYSNFVPIRAEGDLETDIRIEPDVDVRALARRHPSVLARTASKISAEYGLKSAWSEFFPEINGTGSIGRSASDWPPADEDWSVGISLSVPLFQGGNNIEQVYSEKAALREAEEEERSEFNDVLYTLEEKRKNLEDTVEEVAISEQFLAADRERSRISEAQYSHGLLSFDNWIIIEDNLVRSRKAYLEARAAALRARAQWDEARGLTLGFSPDSNPLLRKKRPESEEE